RGLACSPTPSEFPVVAERQVPRNGLPFPVAPRMGNFRKSIDYSVSLNLAILDYAARNGDKLLYNFYKMGKNAIDKGNTDTWTKYPKYIQHIEKAYAADIEAVNKKTKENKSDYRAKVNPKK